MVGLKPDYLQAHQYLAYIYLSELKDYAAAKDEYEKILQLNPQDCQAKGNLGYVLLTLNRAGEAIRPLSEAVSCQSNDVSFNLWLAQAYDITNQYEKAKEAYRKVLRLDPKNKLAKDRLDFLEYNY